MSDAPDDTTDAPEPEDADDAAAADGAEAMLTSS